MSGGGSTTNVTNTGLGDDQFSTLTAGQGAIRNDIAGARAAGDSAIQAVNSNITQGFGNTTNQIAGVNRNIQGLGNQMNTGFTNVGNQITASSNQLGTQLGNQINRVGSDVNTGFNNVGNQINTASQNLGNQMNTGFGAVNQNMAQGFGTVNQNMNQGFADTRNFVGAGLVGLGQGIDARFDEQGNRIDTGFRDAAGQLNSVQANVLGGQANLRTLMEQYGGNLDRYYADLARGQADAQQRLGGLQTGLDQFRGDFRTADTVATQQRARLADTVAGGFNAVRDDFGRGMDTLGNRTQQVAAQVSGLGSQVDQFANQTSINFGALARNISAGFDDNSQQTQAARNDFISRLNSIRGLLDEPDLPLDDTTRQQYGDLASSFDEQGRLIPRSVDGMGNQTARALDAQGNLLMATFDQGGNRINQQALNVDSMLRALDQLGIQSTQTQGLAAPFVSTQ